MASDSSDEVALDPATKSAIREEFDRLYKQPDERIESEIKTFIDQRAVQELLAVADDLERVEEVHEELDTVEGKIAEFYSDIDSIEGILSEARSLSRRVVTLEREIARTRKELGSQLDRLEVTLNDPSLVDDAYMAEEVNTESRSIDDAQAVLTDFESNVTEETDDTPERDVEPARPGETHLRYELQDGTVLKREYDFSEIPDARDEVEIAGMEFSVMSVKHVFNEETDEREHVLLRLS